MNYSKIEKKYPELIGLSYDRQLEILERAKHENNTGSRNRIVKYGMIVAIFMIYGFVRPWIFPQSFWANTISAFVPGFICAFALTLYFRKKFHQKIKELTQKEK